VGAERSGGTAVGSTVAEPDPSVVGVTVPSSITATCDGSWSCEPDTVDANRGREDSAASFTGESAAARTTTDPSGWAEPIEVSLPGWATNENTALAPATAPTAHATKIRLAARPGSRPKPV
jgi:hypothetical protein